MIPHIIKILLALGLAMLIYSIGIPGCSSAHFGSLEEPLSCEEFPTDFNCVSTPKKGLIPEIKKTPAPEKKTPDHSKSVPPPPPPPPPKDYIEFTYDVSLGKKDMIVAVDISSSMAIDQRSFAQQLSPLLNEIKDVDYHLAVITMDISSSPENPVRNAYYQDGRFIPIGGRIYLRNENLGNRPSQKVIEDFKKAIVREETARCDMRQQPRSSGNQYDDFYNKQESIQCPSHDERGTYALNLAIRNPTYQSFFRPGVDTIVTALTDEDIRSSEEYINQPGHEIYAFEAFDDPKILLQNFANRFGKTKSISFYPIIIPPGDSACLNEQNRYRNQGEGTGRGYYGEQYARLAKAKDPELTQYGNLIKGAVISICDRNYGSQLHRVAVSARTIRVPLPCGNPESVDLYVDGHKSRVSYRIEGRTLAMDPGKVKLSSKLKVKILCEE